jgi:hypothetical protein
MLERSVCFIFLLTDLGKDYSVQLKLYKKNPQPFLSYIDLNLPPKNCQFFSHPPGKFFSSNVKYFGLNITKLF